MGAGRLAVQLIVDRPAVRRAGARWSRLPKLKPTRRKGPILPGFDIHIGELAIDRLEIGPAGHRRRRAAGGCRARPTSASGRAMVELGVR